MKIIFDNDGTLTDFNKFINENAINYFKKKYNMKVIYPDMLEVEDIFDMKNFFMNKYGCTLEEAENMVNDAKNKFWISLRFIKFSLLDRFREGSAEFINQLIKDGHDVEIHTSRDKTCENNIIGMIAKNFTILQYYFNGIMISRNKFYFYENDEEKIKGVANRHPNIIFDDKPNVIKQFSDIGFKVVCVNDKHNKSSVFSEAVERIDNFDADIIKSKLNNLLGTKNIKIYNRAAKSDIYFNKLKVLRPLVMAYFKPIIVNKNNLIDIDHEGILYAPNHRSTLDPIVITGVVVKNIHWAALLRFFKGDDSIFNNSKNPILCKITSNLFSKLEYFPIDRIKDNPNANNFDSIKDMNNFLKINNKIGIFAEGTTKRINDEDFGTFDDAFLLLAQKNNSWIQPITTLWIKELDIPQKVIINFGKAFKIENMSIKEAMNHFLEIQKSNLKENEEIRNNLKNNVNVKRKILKK